MGDGTMRSVRVQMGESVRGFGRRAAVVSFLALVGSLGSACTAESVNETSELGSTSASASWPQAPLICSTPSGASSSFNDGCKGTLESFFRAKAYYANEPPPFVGTEQCITSQGDYRTATTGAATSRA